MEKARWEHLPHGADIGVRGIGRTKAEAFEQTAVALTAITTDPRSIAADVLVEIACAADDDELLLVEWLNAVIYEMATRKMLFAKFAVDIKGHSLTARAWGEAIDLNKHDAAVEVKGATYTALKVAQEGDGGWRAQCVIDV